MKNSTLFILLLSFLSLGMYGQPDFPERPNPPRLVNDYINLLSQSQRDHLEEKLNAYHDTTSTQIAVVIVSTIGGDDINLYTAELAHQWGVGQAGKDNGVMILVAKDDRQISIQNGYGVEHLLTDATSTIIIQDYILPNFRNGDFNAGINSGVDQIFLVLSGEFEGKPNRRTGERRVPVFFILIIIVIVMYLLIKRGGGGNHGGGYWIGGGHFGGGFGSGSSFGGSSGFGGGGFGGFGGGGFGGGGSSGSW